MRTFLALMIISIAVTGQVQAQQNPTSGSAGVSMDVGRNASGAAAEAARQATARAVDDARKEAAKAAASVAPEPSSNGSKAVQPVSPQKTPIP